MFDFDYSVFQVSPSTQDQIGMNLGTEVTKVSKFHVEKEYPC